MEQVNSLGQTIDQVLADCRTQQSTMRAAATARPPTIADRVQADALAEARRMHKSGETATLTEALRSLATAYPGEYAIWLDGQRRANDARMNRERGFVK